MALKLTTPPPKTGLKPRIVVVGVGGAGSNAVDNMIRSNLEGVEFIVANTDAQSLEFSSATRKVQLGTELTQGLGAGANPNVGRDAAKEAIDELMGDLEGAHMVFITAGMGGGTGTGAAPVIAEAARGSGILTVGVVTKPFQFEGTRRMHIAEEGINELQQYVDTLIIIPNQNLFRVANQETTFAEAFNMADDVLYSGVRGVTDLMVMPGLINLDFSDIRTVMGEMGKAMMGTGEAKGEKRATLAAEAAISNPLLEDVSMKGALRILINITGGNDMTLFEVDEAVNRIRSEVDPGANIIFGSALDENLDGTMRVSVVATGIDGEDSDMVLQPEMPDSKMPDPKMSGHSTQAIAGLAAKPEMSEEEAAVSATATTELNETATLLDAATEEALGSVAEEITDTISTDDPATQDMFQADSNHMSTEDDHEKPTSHGEVEHPPVTAVAAEEAPQQAEMARILRPLPKDEAKETRPLRPSPKVAASRDSFIPDKPAKAVDFSAPATEAGKEKIGKEKQRGFVRSIFFKQEEQVDISSHPTVDRPQQAAAALQPAQTDAEAGNGPPKAEDEFLEIPSFLRRQAN